MSPTPVVVVAIATGPDMDGARRLQDFGTLDDDGIARALATQRLQRHGDEALPIHLQRLIGIGAVRSDAGGARLWPQPGAATSEADGLRALLEFAAGATWISWRGDEWPVLRCRSLVHALVAPGLWPAQRSLVDLMSAIFGAGAEVALEGLAGLLDLPLDAVPSAEMDPFAACARTAVQSFCVYRAWQVALGECAPAQARRDLDSVCAALGSRAAGGGCR